MWRATVLTAWLMHRQVLFAMLAEWRQRVDWWTLLRNAGLQERQGDVMASTVVGLFDNASEADAAVRELRDTGFSSDAVSLVANNAADATGSAVQDGALTGGALGGLAGLLIGLTALAIPGIGPVITAGTVGAALASTALGTALGATVGGLVGALVNAGIPEEDANVYAEGVGRGGALLIVRAETPDEAAKAVAVMNRHNVVDIGRRAQEYRAGGWTRFDDRAQRETVANRQVEQSSNTITPAPTDQSSSTTARAETDQPPRPSTQARQVGGEEVVIVIVEEDLPLDARSLEPRGSRVYDRGTQTTG